MKICNGVVEGYIVLAEESIGLEIQSWSSSMALQLVNVKGVDRRVSESKEGHASITNILRSG